MTAPRGTAPPGAVHLIGGRLRRSRLPVLHRPGLRPTPERLRQTLFDWLGGDLTGWRVLDAFAGSGALGFEAASRGAAEVVLVERDAALVASLVASAQRIGATAVRVERDDTLRWMARCASSRFDLVLLDPPYDAGLLARAVDLARPLLVAGGCVYAESDAAELAPPPGWTADRHARAGAVHGRLWRRDDTALDCGAAPREEPR